ncbi:MAG TPA: hypothetical protein VM305_01485 [Candidatus Limnocylindrales bacterium]|nr:hypothetical protein [Candidatus Limnocylindrales bacterium]
MQTRFRASLAPLLLLALLFGACTQADQQQAPNGTTPAQTPTSATLAPEGTPGGDVDAGSCEGELAAESVDEVVVPDDASCRLTGTSVGGNVRLGSNSTLNAEEAQIGGDVQAQGANEVNLRGSSIGGNVQLEQGGAAVLTENEVGGDIQLESNTGQLTIDGNTVGGNVQANQNSGGLNVTRNEVDGNLECQGNEPPPVGGENEVQGSKEEQCENL